MERFSLFNYSLHQLVPQMVSKIKFCLHTTANNKNLYLKIIMHKLLLHRAPTKDLLESVDAQKYIHQIKIDRLKEEKNVFDVAACWWISTLKIFRFK